jgi:PAS domain S-box-containing protein
VTAAAESVSAGLRGPFASIDLRCLLALAMLAFAYVFFARVGFAFAFATRQVTAVWPPTGIAVAALLLLGYRIWPGVWLGAFISNAISDVPLLAAAGIASGNTLGPLLAAFLLRRFVGFEISLARVRDVLGLIVFGAVLAMGVTATNGVLNLALAGVVSWSSSVSVWWVWWVGDAMGVLLVAPVILTWAADPKVRWRKTKLLELTILFVALIAIGGYSFTGSLPIGYPVFPIIIWSALRFGQREMATAIVAISAIAIWRTVHDQGPFAGGSLDQHLILLVTFMAVVGMTGLLLGAVTTERWRAEERLRESEDRFRRVVEASPSALVMIDQTGRIALVNGQADAVFGYARDELIGQPVEILVPDRVRASHPAHRAGFFAAPSSRAMGSGRDLYACRKDGSEFPVEIGLSPIVTADGPMVLSAIVDISQRKQREVELAKAKTDAEAASRAKSDFLSQMNHELRTPLNAVIGFAQLLQLDRDRTLSARQKEYCQDILRGGHDLLELINELLDLSRIEAGQVKLSVERVAVADVLAQIHDAMSLLAIEAGVRLEVNQAAGVPDIRADALRLRQILLNLVSNAIKYNRKGGSVLVTVLAAVADRVRIIVVDTGVGIAPERQDELFTPFNRLGAEYTAIEGTGLGLALSKMLVEAMDGTIGFTSRPGEGSTFWIELPAEAFETRPTRASAAAASSKEGVSRATAGGYSVLYVEDNPVSLRLMEHLVSTLPNVVMLAAPRPQLGLDLARTHRPDVIVLDLNLPNMDGFKVLACLKAAPETCDIPVIALTAAARPNDIERGLAAGFFRYVTKPIDVKTFFAAVDDALTAARRASGSR